MPSGREFFRRFITFALFQIFFVYEAQALSCVRDIKKSYENSDTIFIGEVLNYKLLDPLEKKLPYKGAESIAKVIEPIKGPVVKDDKLTIDLMAFYGPAKLYINHKYIFFLYKDSKNDSYQLPICGMYYEYPTQHKELVDLLKLKANENY